MNIIKTILSFFSFFIFSEKSYYVCTRCGSNEKIAARYGCSMGPCPMELK